MAEYRDRGRADPAHFLMHPLYDNILNQLADHFLGYWKDRMALLGLGGYGRKEMSPYSDIDLLFLRPEDAPEGIYRGIRNILYLLWDARVELGHSVRTVQECCTEADKDLAVLTSLLDTRFVWGEESIYRQLLVERERLIRDTDPLEIYLKIEGEVRKSSEKFGHTIYLLEPHLKEGPGSLRYIQLTAWLAHMIFGCRTLDDLALMGACGAKAIEEVSRGKDFLVEVRTRLHFLAGRRDDRLKFDAQTEIADQMEFSDAPGRKGVESFMREYYRHASTVDFFGRRIFARARLFLRPKIASELKQLKLDDSFYVGAGGIHHFYPEQFGRNPKEIIQAFQKIVDTGCDLDIRLVDLIRLRLRSWDAALIHEPETNRLFLELFRSRGAIGTALNAMMKIGVLEEFITEFARVRFLPQHDIYHQYTVDLHTMAVLECIQSFGKPADGTEDMLVRTIFSRVEKPEVLYLAGLFHDMAKGQGPGHEVRGEELARPILKSLGLPEEDIDDVCFLIRNHLAMTHLAFKKDLHDGALINRFAENVMLRKRLDLLMLLTQADLRAVGPTAFTSWRKMLLEELYYRTLDVVEGEGIDGEDLADWVSQVKAAVRAMVPNEFRGAHLDGFLEAAGSRYFLDYYPGVIVDHYVDLRSHLVKSGTETLAPDEVIARRRDYPGVPAYSSISLILRDRQGLFYRVAGSLSANRINILSAWTHSVGDVAVLTFHVNDIPEGPVDDPERWAGFRRDFGRVLSGEADVGELVAAKRPARSVFPVSSKPRFPLKVEIDNAASDRATIIEVYAHDRPGLLYDITRQISSLGLYITLTKITTEVDQALDVFYVLDEDGSKVLDFDRLDGIKTSLHDHLGAMEEKYFSETREGVF
jgi:[protein-PII] uridylyltransferase